MVAVPLTADVCLQVKIGASARLLQSDFGFTFDGPDSHALAEMLGEIGEYCATRGEPCCQLLRSTPVAIKQNEPGPGFYRAAPRLGLLSDSATIDECRIFWARERERCFEH